MISEHTQTHIHIETHRDRELRLDKINYDESLTAPRTCTESGAVPTAERITSKPVRYGRSKGVCSEPAGASPCSDLATCFRALLYDTPSQDSLCYMNIYLIPHSDSLSDS